MAKAMSGPDPLDMAKLAAERGVRVYTIGVGSPEGTILRIQGRAVRTRLDEETLKRMSISPRRILQRHQ